MRARGFGLSASVAVALLVVGSGSASAASITFQFGGTVTSLDGFTSPPFAGGDPFSLTITADDADTDGSSERGVYAITALSFFAGSYTGSAPAGSIALLDFDLGLQPLDDFVASATSTEGLNGAAVDGLPLTSVGIGLVDQDGTVFASDALVPILSLDEFEGRSFLVLFCSSITDRGGCSDSDLTARVTGQLTFVTSSVSSVPEPGTIALVATGLVAVSRRRHRHA